MSTESPTTTANGINVRTVERIASAIGGSLLALYGLRRYTWTGVATAAAGGAMIYRGITGHCPIYGQLGISTASKKATEPIIISEALTVNRPRQEVYEFWRDLENLPRFMRHLASVEHLNDGRSRWTARLPKDLGTLTWEAETTDDRPNEQISWQSLPGADVQHAGTVHFEDGPRGSTEVHVEISYRPPAAKAGRLVAQLINPANAQLIREDVRRFKHLLEAGEIPRIEGQPSGRAN